MECELLAPSVLLGSLPYSVATSCQEFSFSQVAPLAPKLCDKFSSFPFLYLLQQTCQQARSVLHSKSLLISSASLCLHWLQCRLALCRPETGIRRDNWLLNMYCVPCKIFSIPWSNVFAHFSLTPFTAPVWDCLESKYWVWSPTSGLLFQMQIRCSAYHPTHPTKHCARGFVKESAGVTWSSKCQPTKRWIPVRWLLDRQDDDEKHVFAL